jgi:uncharacterized membrane protein
MIATTFSDVIDTTGKVLDAAGVAVMALGIVVATVSVGLNRLRGAGEDGYRTLRQNVGRSILLGLELLVAGDIIRTVAVEPTFRSVGVLAVIVLIRTFLSFTLEVELRGSWPWRRSRDEVGTPP